MHQSRPLRQTLAGFAIGAILVMSMVWAAAAQESEAEAAEAAAALLTAAVLGDELTEPIHDGVLGLYYDDDADEYVVVVPDTGDVPEASDYAEFGLPVRIERRDATTADVEEIGRLLRQFAEESGEGIGFYFDAESGKVLAQGTAEPSLLSEVIDRFPDTLAYEQIDTPDGPARWWVDPVAIPLADDARSIPASIRERACASGRSPEGRVNEPTIEYGIDAITVSFTVQGLGMAQCPGNPSHAFVIELDEPVGSRALLDGSVEPNRDALSGDPDT